MCNFVGIPLNFLVFVSLIAHVFINIHENKIRFLYIGSFGKHALS